MVVWSLVENPTVLHEKLSKRENMSAEETVVFSPTPDDQPDTDDGQCASDDEDQSTSDPPRQLVDRTRNRSPRATMADIYETKIERQLNNLEKMGCRPRWKKVTVKTLLDDQNELYDQLRLVPEVVLVKRCIPECSYCGDYMGGMETAECTSTKNNTMKFPVRYYNSLGKRQYHIISLYQHTACACL